MRRPDPRLLALRDRQARDDQLTRRAAETLQLPFGRWTPDQHAAVLRLVAELRQLDEEQKP